MSIHTPGGQQLADQLGFRSTPEFILFDRLGEESYRGNRLPDAAVLDAAER